MSNPWKLATIGLLLVLFSSLVTALGTAHFTRLAPPPQDETALTDSPAVPVRPPTPASAVRRPVPVRPTSVATTSVASAPATTTSAAGVPVPASTPADCATAGERAWRIAKPGLIGGLIGAGVGAAGGTIADGGKGAGKGVLIGSLTGAALGTAYGVYNTKEQCGTILGGPGAIYALR